LSKYKDKFMWSEYLIIGSVALLASGLTLFSGFGLGTLLLPAFALFFPVEVAIGMTALVHFLNNIFKLVLLGRKADHGVIFRFGLPAILAALAGAWLLILFSEAEPLYRHQLFGAERTVNLVSFVIGLLILLFVVIESLPGFQSIALDRKYLPLGGLISGFFGGLSGHQGALRSMFLLRAGLEKESFIATGVVIAVLIDISRLGVYSTRFSQALNNDYFGLLLVAVLMAFTGAYLGNRLLKKMTMKLVQRMVSLMLALIAAGLITGLI